MAHAVVMHAPGGPEVLKLEPIEVGRPGKGEIRLRQTAVGVNFHDVYVRSGAYRTLALPGIPGLEAAGVVQEVGPGVAHLRAGDRVAYLTRRYGGYASERLLPAAIAVPLPAGVDDRVAAAAFLKGLTVEMLVRRVHALRAGDHVLVHAAAGGVGRLLAQWAAHLGAVVIGTVGSPAKAEIARAAGCAHVLLYRQEDVVARAREITAGQGVAVIYDAIGRDTFAGSLEALAVRGHLVNYGQASGPVEPVALSSLAGKSLTLSRPAIFDYVAERGELEAAAAALFAGLAEGWLTVDRLETHPLADAAAAHARLESAMTTSPLVLLPGG